MTELFRYLEIETDTNVFVNTPKHYQFNETIPVYFNITLPYITCAVLTVDVEDVLGRYDFSHDPAKVKFYRLLYNDENIDSPDEMTINRKQSQPKRRMNRFQKRPTQILPFRKSDFTSKKFMGENELKKLLQDGCRIEANIEIKRVHGNIHLSGHAHEDLLDVWIKYNEQIDLSHYIETFHFGNPITRKSLSSMMTSNKVTHDSLAFDPLNGFTSMTPPMYFESDIHLSKSHSQGTAAPSHDHSKIKITYEYYFQIVTTLFENVIGNKHKSYQFTVSSNINENRYQTPVIFFRYDINPMTVEFIEKRRSFSHFAVQLSAIIGGAFVMFGFLNSILLVINRRFFKFSHDKLY